MSLWVVAYCTKPIHHLSLDEISEALDVADFAMMAEGQDLDEEVGYAARDALRFEEENAAKSRVLLVHYRHHRHGDTWMRCDIHEQGAFVAECVEEVREREPPEVVRQYASRTLETVAFELKVSDWEGMGLPIAFHLAMWFALPDRGDGIVEVEDEWWDPRTYEQVGASEPPV